MEKIIN